MSLREQILARASQTPALVPIEGGAFAGGYVRAMTAAERDAYEAEQFEASKCNKALDNFRARLVAKVVVGEDGNRLFTDDDAATLGALPATDIRPVFELAARVNALTAEDQRELEKNS